MPLTREEMDRKIDEHFASRRATTCRASWPHCRPRWSTTSSAGPPARPAAARAPRPFYEALFADLSDGKVTA